MSENTNDSDFKIIYDSNQEQQNNMDISMIISETTNLIDPLINIVNDYKDEDGKILYVVSRSISYNDCNINHGIYSTFQKALVGILSIVYRESDYHKYNSDTKIWDFDYAIKNKTIKDLYIQFEYTSHEDASYERYFIYEFKLNYFGKEDVYYEIRYGKLHKNGILITPQPDIITSWWEQLNNFVAKW